jgi:hypothetical protein
MNVLDTNVWLYGHDTRDPHKQARALHLWATIRPLALPWQDGCEFLAASRKLATIGFTEAQAWAALTQMLGNVFILQFARTQPKDQLEVIFEKGGGPKNLNAFLDQLRSDEVEKLRALCPLQQVMAFIANNTKVAAQQS